MGKRLLIVVFSLFVCLIVGIAIYTYTVTNVIEYYIANIDIDSAGNITVHEEMVVNYKTVQNELWRDIKYNKYFGSNPLFDDVSQSLYSNDIADFSESETSVKVYRGNKVDDTDYEDITNSVRIGYSYNGDVDKFGDSVACDCQGQSYCSTRCESLYIDATNAGSFTGYITFEYTYTINGMVSMYNDCAELNYVLFNYVPWEIKTAAVTFSLPSTNIPEEDLYCYGHGINNGKITQNRNSIDYIAENIGDGEEFECRVVFPNFVLENINEKNIIKTDMLDKIKNYENDLYLETMKRYRVGIIVNVITVIVVIGMAFITVWVYRRYDKEFIPEFNHEYLRELPRDYSPAEMSYLYYFGKTNDEDVTATLLDLVRRGYLELITKGSVTDKNPDFTIKVTSKPQGDLRPHEAHLINWFVNRIGDGSEVTIKQIESFGKKYKDAEEFQKYGSDFKKKIKEECKNYDFFLNTMNDKNKVLPIGFLPICVSVICYFLASSVNLTCVENIFILIAVGLIYIAYVSVIKKRSKNGNEEYAMWKAFKKFLEDFSSFEDYPMPGIIVWEHFLVYATSLKIADKVMDQLKVKLPSMELEEGTYLRTSHNRYYVFYSYNRIGTSLSKARSNSISTIAAHHAAKTGGGSGHGGGFTGGSSFGGGGGGFRSR